MMSCCGSSYLLATTLFLLVGSFAQAFVTTTGPQYLSSSSASSGLPIITTDNGSPMMTSEDDNSDEDDFSSMMGMPGGSIGGSPGQTVYVIEFETEADKASGSSHRNRKDMSDDGSDGQSPLDPWSIVWYIGSFGGLIAFFLIVSCSEWCCRRGARPLNNPYTQRGEVMNANGTGTNAGLVTESPPPPYHLFAPPPYDSVNYAEIAGDCSKQPASATSEKLDIYVISLPIQAAPAQPPPA